MGDTELQRKADAQLDELREVTASRDDRVLFARRVGFSKKHIHEKTGIARTTINRILREEAA